MPCSKVAMDGTILITGGTQSLGYEAAIEIAKQAPDCHVVLASRSNADAADKINLLLKQKNVSYQRLDLGNRDSVRTFADSFNQTTKTPIRALVLNAGLQFPGPVGYNEDGIEKTFAVNHLNHCLLFHLLYPHLASDARIVITASGTHDPAKKTGVPEPVYNTPEELAHPSAQSSTYEGRQRYSTSKLCNVLWTYALHQRLSARSDNRITVTAMDPGLMLGTGLTRDSAVVHFLNTWILASLAPLFKWLLSQPVNTPQESGLALARLAVGHDVQGRSGMYYEGFKQIDSSRDSYDQAKQDDLWHWTVGFVAQDENERMTFDLAS